MNSLIVVKRPPGNHIQGDWVFTLKGLRLKKGKNLLSPGTRWGKSDFAGERGEEKKSQD